MLDFIQVVLLVICLAGFLTAFLLDDCDWSCKRALLDVKRQRMEAELELIQFFISLTPQFKAAVSKSLSEINLNKEPTGAEPMSLALDDLQFISESLFSYSSRYRAAVNKKRHPLSTRLHYHDRAKRANEVNQRVQQTICSISKSTTEPN